MFREKYNLRIAIYSLFFTMVIASGVVNCFAQAQKVAKLMPPETELLSQKQDKSQQLVTVTTYKYASTSKKAKLLEFYRQLFKNEGYQELEGYSPEKQKAGPHEVFFFAKGNELAILSLTNTIENNKGIYFVTLNEPNVEAVKSFNIKDK